MSRRAFSTLIVLIVLTLSALVASTALTIGSARVASTHASMDSDELRALGWSGIQAVMSELGAQRDELLRGGEPDITEEIVVYETDTERGVVKLIAFDPDAVTPVASEAARVNLNTASKETLLGLQGMNEAWADAIVAAREATPFDSPERVLALDGADEGAWDGGASSLEQDGASLEIATGAEIPFGDDSVIALRDLVTVFSADPNVQAGIGTDGDQFAGERRLPMNRGWSEELEAAIEERLGSGWATTLRSPLRAENRVIDDYSKLASVATNGQSEEGWLAFWDALCVTDAPFVAGMIDVNRAPVDVLKALPDLTPEAAEAIVAARDGLSEDTRAGLDWIAQSQATGIEFGALATLRNTLTTRSLQWRVRLEARVERFLEDGNRVDVEADSVLPELEDDQVRGRRLVYEAVIDVATPRPRVAYLRDVTHESLARALHEAASLRRELEPEPEPGMDASPETQSPSYRPSGPSPDPASSDAGGADGEGRSVERPSYADTDARVGRWRGGGG